MVFLLLCLLLLCLLSRKEEEVLFFFFPLTFETDLSEERGKKDTKKKLKIIGNISDAKKSPTKEEKIPLPAS